MRARELMSQADGNGVGDDPEYLHNGRMTQLASATFRKKAVTRISELIGQTLEEEILTLDSLEPDMMARLPSLFSRSVIDSLISILGESSGEALIRRIGDERLMSPAEVYESLDKVLRSGSEILKVAIREDFRVRVHRLYKMTGEHWEGDDGYGFVARLGPRHGF